jgi:hypothetical protein
MRKYHWQEKLITGEYISTWNGYIPFYAGCFMVPSLSLAEKTSILIVMTFFWHRRCGVVD